MSSHSLHIETGRWRRPDPTPPDERFCQNCQGKIEDEYHIIMECSLLFELRKQLISKKYWARPSMQNLVNLLNSKNKKTLNGLAKFVHLAFKLRDQTLQ